MSIEGPEPSKAPGRVFPWRTLARVAMTLLLVAFLLWKVPFSELYESFQKFKISGVVLALFGLVIQAVLGSVRWKRMLSRTGENLPLRVLLGDTLVGSAYNLILPSSMGGDVVRIYRCSQRLEQGHRAWSTTIFERLVGLGSLAAFSAPGIMVVPGGRALLVPTLLVAGASVAVLIFAKVPLKLLARLATKRTPQLAMTSGKIAADLEGPLGTTSARLEAFFWSLLYQFAGISVVVALVVPNGDINLIKALYAGVPLITIASMLPITIAGIGLRETLFVTVLGKFGVDKATALALALAWFGSYFFVAAAGVVVSVMDPVSLIPGTVPTDPKRSPENAPQPEGTNAP
jgi:glycosyltransferase 2 family protein